MSDSIQMRFVKSYMIPFLVFVSLTVLGFSTYRDYGISWDEPHSRMNGVVSLSYALDRLGIDDDKLPHPLPDAPPLSEWTDKDYPVLFDLPLTFLEVMLGLDDPQEIFELRHIATYLVWLLGVISIYFMASILFKSTAFSIFALVIYVISPRLFGEAFYNSKDIVFMSVFSISMLFATIFFQKPTFIRMVLFAFATAMAINVRMMGIILIPTFLFIAFIDFLTSNVNWRYAASTLCYLIFVPVFTYLMWPYLWESPLENFITAYQNMSHFRWLGTVLFDGQRISSVSLPWNYIPSWISITTPIWILLLFSLGTLVVISNLRALKTSEKRTELFYLLLFLLPIFAVIVLKAVMYDGWRQMYFLYPSITMVALSGAVASYRFLTGIKYRSFGFAALFFLAIFVVHDAIWMVRNHPLQNLYFNPLTDGKTRYKNWEMDYWGLANKMALEHILAGDNREKIRVFAGSSTPLSTAFYMIDQAVRPRLEYVGHVDEADYVVSNCRGIEDCDGQNFDNFSLVWKKIVDESPIVWVYRRSAAGAQ